MTLTLILIIWQKRCIWCKRRAMSSTVIIIGAVLSKVIFRLVSPWGTKKKEKRSYFWHLNKCLCRFLLEASVSHSVVSDSLWLHGLSMEFSRQEYWSGLPFPSPGDFPNPGTEPGSPALQVDSFPSELPGKPRFFYLPNIYIYISINIRETYK